MSTEDDIWIAETNDNVIGLSINGRDGVDKISFENYRPESSEIGSLYQGFEGAILEIGTNSWINTSDYSQLDFIEAPDTSNWTLSYSNNKLVLRQALYQMEFFRGITGVLIKLN